MVQYQSHLHPRATKRAVDGLTAAEREKPYTENPALLAREERFADESPDQLPLFAPGPAGTFSPALGGLPPCRRTAVSSWLDPGTGASSEQAERPTNTVESYCYDLVVLEKLIGPNRSTPSARRTSRRLLGDAERQGYPQAPADLGPTLFPIPDRRCAGAALRPD